MAALIKDFYIEQDADWPGMAFSIVDAFDQPKPLDNSTMVASGFIGHLNSTPLFVWSNHPADDSVGLVVFENDLFIPQVSAAQNRLWSFANAPYQLYLFDPAGPPGDQKIRVGRGTVYLDRALG
jgi:hypothetical protein